MDGIRLYNPLKKKKKKEKGSCSSRNNKLTIKLKNQTRKQRKEKAVQRS